MTITVGESTVEFELGIDIFEPVGTAEQQRRIRHIARQAVGNHFLRAALKEHERRTQ